MEQLLAEGNVYDTFEEFVAAKREYEKLSNTSAYT